MALPAWMALVIERVRATTCAELVLVVAGRAERTNAISPGLIGKARATLERWAVDSAGSGRDALEQVDVSALVAGVPRLEAARRGAGASAEYAAADLTEIKACELDVLVDLGSSRLAGGILESARYGVWSYSGVDAHAAFWDVAERRLEIRTALELVTAAGGKTLYESSSAIERTCVMTSRNRAYWKTASFVTRALEALHRERAETFTQRAAALAPETPADRRPGILQLAASASLRYLERRVERTLRRWSREQWVLLYAFGEAAPEDNRSFKTLVPPKDRYWADPHVVARDGHYYVFVEEYLYATDRGHLSVLELDANGTYKPPVPIIERPYHLSYPHVFSWRGELYLVPESKQNRSIEVYRCTQFPYVWEPAAVLMHNVEAVDTTLLEHGGRWWLFANMVENAGASSWDELFLFSADSPLSDHWVPHPLNPVISDVKCARPAGRIFTRNGRLYRPSQNCSHRYGYGFNISEITELTATSYSERVVKRVEPNWDPSIFATHTFASEHGLTVIDGLRRFWRRPRARSWLAARRAFVSKTNKGSAFHHPPLAGARADAASPSGTSDGLFGAAALAGHAQEPAPAARTSDTAQTPHM
jgi:hypothetical protein